MSDTNESSETLNPASDPQSEAMEPTQTTAGPSDDQSQNEEPAEFNPAALEEQFGLPGGSLQDVKDEETAHAAIRDYVSRVLAAGVGLESSTAEHVAQQTKAEAKKPAGGKDKPGETATNAELESLRAEVAALKDLQDKELQRRERQALAEIDRRFMSEVNGWKSPKYGVAGHRTYEQAKAVKQLRDELVPMYITGATTAGLGVPTIEIVARNCRKYQDESYGAKATGGATTTPPLGTPGGAKRDQAGKQPANVHEALMRMNP